MGWLSQSPLIEPFPVVQWLPCRTAVWAWFNLSIVGFVYFILILLLLSLCHGLGRNLFADPVMPPNGCNGPNLDEFTRQQVAQSVLSYASLE